MIRLLFITLLTTSLLGCQSAYYGALEKVGIHKRDVLVSRVEKTRDSQEEAKQQFANALEQFRSIKQFDGGDLEVIYNKLNDEYEASQTAADSVSSRIDAVEAVSEALFEEWEEELAQYTSDSLRRKSAAQMNQTKRQYNKLIRSMRNAEKSMSPVLNVFKDNVLYLKHNLNARAIASLKSELKSIESNVSRLIKQMNRSINEANSFIEEMSEGS